MAIVGGAATQALHAFTAMADAFAHEAKAIKTIATQMNAIANNTSSPISNL